MSVTPQFLLQGFAYALEQCGLLLRDANILYRSRSYAGTVVMTHSAREELGRSDILLDLWRQAPSGKTITVKQIKNACKDHVTKQREGMLSVTTADGESDEGKLLRAKWANPPQSPERKKADEELRRIDEERIKHTPDGRHKQRLDALYVDPISESQWNRPAATSASTAQQVLQDAVNDYKGSYDRYVQSKHSTLKEDDPDLYAALEQWSDRPNLLWPES
jgi:AbiV family abortive infection protein